MGRKVDVFRSDGLVKRWIAVDTHLYSTPVIRLDKTSSSVHRCGKCGRRNAYRLGTYDVSLAPCAYGIDFAFAEKAIKCQSHLQRGAFTPNISPVGFHLKRIREQYDGSTECGPVNGSIHDACGNIPRKTGQFRCRQPG